jgi:thioredoxin 1
MFATLATSTCMVIVTRSNFDAIAASPDTVILDCSAEWCPPCRTFAPIFAAAAERRSDLTWGTVDTDAEPELAAALDIRAQPTVIVLRGGAVVHKHVGAMSAKKLDELLERVTRA